MCDDCTKRTQRTLRIPLCVSLCERCGVERFNRMSRVAPALGNVPIQCHVNDARIIEVAPRHRLGVSLYWGGGGPDNLARVVQMRIEQRGGWRLPCFLCRRGGGCEERPCCLVHVGLQVGEPFLDREAVCEEHGFDLLIGEAHDVAPVLVPPSARWAPGRAARLT